MSNFTTKSVHKKTGETHRVEWLDDYFGKHVYGMRCPDGRVINHSEYMEIYKEIDDE